MNWLNQLERKYRKYAISNLIVYIIALNALVFFVDFVLPRARRSTCWSFIPTGSCKERSGAW